MPKDSADVPPSDESTAPIDDELTAPYDTGEVRKLGDLPARARAYLDRIEELTGAPVQWVSVGTKRSQIIPVGS